MWCDAVLQVIKAYNLLLALRLAFRFLLAAALLLILGRLLPYRPCDRVSVLVENNLLGSDDGTVLLCGVCLGARIIALTNIHV